MCVGKSPRLFSKRASCRYEAVSGTCADHRSQEVTDDWFAHNLSPALTLDGAGTAPFLEQDIDPMISGSGGQIRVVTFTSKQLRNELLKFETAYRPQTVCQSDMRRFGYVVAEQMQ